MKETEDKDTLVTVADYELPVAHHFRICQTHLLIWHPPNLISMYINIHVITQAKALKQHLFFTSLHIYTYSLITCQCLHQIIFQSQHIFFIPLPLSSSTPYFLFFELLQWCSNRSPPRTSTSPLLFSSLLCCDKKLYKVYVCLCISTFVSISRKIFIVHGMEQKNLKKILWVNDLIK